MPRSGIPAYLAKYAEAGEEALLDLDLDLDCSHAICIPACSEDERFLDTLESLRAVEGGDAALVILVVNGAEDSPEAVHDANRLFLEWLRACLRIPSKPIALTRWKGLRILVLDHASSGRRLPAKQGVGLARKIASDLALRWYAKGHIRSPWMCCTDADVELPPDYLTGLPPGDSRYAAVLYPFVHQLEGDASQRQAMRLYESFLHYFVLGLRWAGSPYAYHSIGSSFAVHMERYAAVRGFPRRRAAEDFYLLNKLIKQAPLLSVQTQPIRIRGRESERVPFGTGRALSEIQALADPYRVYDPRVFTALKCWISVLERYSESPDTVDLESELDPPELPVGLLRSALIQLGAIDAAHHAREQTRPGMPLRRRLFEWNDAFRSLRLVHLLRDGGLPSLELREAVARAPFIDGGRVSDDVDTTWALLTRAVALQDSQPVGLF